MLTLTLWSHLRTLMVRINQKGIFTWSLKCVILSVFLNAAYVVTRMAWKIQISGQLGAGHDMWLAEDAPDMSWYYITNETVGWVCYYQLISGKSYSPITGNCHSKFFPTSSNRDIFFTDDAAQKFFPTSKISAQEIRHQFYLIWSNLTIMAHIMGLGNQ